MLFRSLTETQVSGLLKCAMDFAPANQLFDQPQQDGAADPTTGMDPNHLALLSALHQHFQQAQQYNEMMSAQQGAEAPTIGDQ